MEAMRRAVEEVLEEIGADSSPRVLVLNKADLLDEQARQGCACATPRRCSSAASTGEGLDELAARIESELRHTLCPLDLLVPYASGSSLAELHEVAGELARRDTPEGVRVRALVPARLAPRFARFAVA